MKSKAWVAAAESGDQVILVGLDFSFGDVGAMEVRGDKLEIDALLIHELLQSGGTCIVRYMEERAETVVTEVGVEDLVGMFKLLCAV